MFVISFFYWSLSWTYVTHPPNLKKHWSWKKKQMAVDCVRTRHLRPVVCLYSGVVLFKKNNCLSLTFILTTHRAAVLRHVIFINETLNM